MTKLGLTDITDEDLGACYEAGFAKHGLGAVVILGPGVWRFESKQSLQRFRRMPLWDDPLVELQHQSTNIADLVHEIAQAAPDHYVVARKHPRFWLGSYYWPFSWKLSIHVYRRSRPDKPLSENTPSDKESSRAINPQELEDSRNRVIQKSNQVLAWLDGLGIEACFKEGLAKHGPGAVKRLGRSNRYYLPLDQLHHFDRLRIVGGWEYSQQSLTEVVEQCPAGRFVLFEELYRPFWPLGRHLWLAVMTMERQT